MPTVRTLARSFSSGELTPELFGRVDLNKFQSGLALCRNFVVMPHGPVRNRTGSQFVKEVGNGSLTKTRLIPFSYSNLQTFAIELGAGFIRWHTQGGTLLCGTLAGWGPATLYNQGATVLYSGRNYYAVQPSIGMPPSSSPAYWYQMPADGTFEIPNPYLEAELFDIHYVQSADVMTFVHPNHTTLELRRLGALLWTLIPVSFAPTITPPTAVNVAVSSGSGGTPKTQSYCITAISATNNLDQSLASNPSLGSLTANITAITQANPGVVTTAAAHGMALGDPVLISGVGGMTQIAGYYTIGSVPSTTTLTLIDSTGTPVNTTAWGPYTSGGAITLCGVKLDLTIANSNTTITWTQVPGALRYNVFKYSNGLYGYIGQTAALSFVDSNITADISNTPPNLDTTLNTGANYYPQAVGYFEQRRVFGGWNASPQSILATRSGTESNVNYHIPSVADDRLSLRIAAREASSIRHIVPVQDVILLTASNEFRMYASDGNAISATNVTVKPQAYVGANNVQPVVVGNTILYAASRGGHLRELSFNWQAQSYLTGDISLMAPHLFDYHSILDMAFAKAPYPVLWCVNEVGTLLGMTYVPEQQISAWHHHDTTNGAFESCCCVTENGEDMLYVIVRRVINGAQHRYVERMASRNFPTQADSYFVDCGATYSGTPTSTISGLTWLIGQTVSVLGDGAAMPQVVVDNTGTITLQQAVSKAQIGLPITADLQTLPFVYAATDFGQGRPKNVNRAYVRVVSSSGIFAGPNFGALVQYAQRSTEPWGTPPALVTDEIEIIVSNAWDMDGHLCFRQSDPLPMTVVSATLDVAIGG